MNPNDNRIRIARSSGTDPISNSPIPQPHALPAATLPMRMASIEEEGANFIARSGSMRLRIDDGSVAKYLRRRESTPRPAAVSKIPVALEAAVAAARQFGPELLRLPGVVNVRAGYFFANGQITEHPCVVVAVAPGASPAIPASLPNSIPLQTALATPVEMLTRREAARGGDGAETAALRELPRLFIEQLHEERAAVAEAVTVITYEPPPEGDLSPVSGAMTVTCHVSPEAGWSVLEPFLQAATDTCVVGMYDFTAPHIYAASRRLLRNSGLAWKQTLGPGASLAAIGDVDSTKAQDRDEDFIVRGLERAGRQRFSSAYAQVGSGKTFASSYHIKLAVRDRRAIWLSSGSWQSSNQPEADFLAVDADLDEMLRYNREWHIIVENPTLARRFERFLQHDFDTASNLPEAGLLEAAALPDLLVEAENFEERAPAGLQRFAPRRFTFTSAQPLTITPILTPDNYMEVVLPFLRERPLRSLYFQNQSLNPILNETAQYSELLQLLADYSQDPALDVRIVFRQIGDTRAKLESLQARGFNMSRVRVQKGCHTKGIIVDSEALLLGSHNITNQGTQVNRDASLLIRHKGIAQYYERVFLHDWDVLSRPGLPEESAILLADDGESAANFPGRAHQDLVRVPFSAFMEE